MSNNRKKANVSNRRWSGYAMAGAAALGGAQAAEADVVHVDAGTPNSGLPSAPVDTTGQFAAAGFAVADNAGNLGSANGLNLSFSQFCFCGGAGRPGGNAFMRLLPGSNVGAFAQHRGFLTGSGTTLQRYVSNVDFGELVSAGPFLPAGRAVGTMAGFNARPNDEFTDPGEAYVAFRFDNADGSGIQHGWARVELVTGAPENAISVLEYAYTTAGEPLRVGQIPEPGTLGLLALGAAGVAAARRRQAG